MRACAPFAWHVFLESLINTAENSRKARFRIACYVKLSKGQKG